MPPRRIPFAAWWARRTLARGPFPRRWRPLVAAGVPHWRVLDDAERERLEATIVHLLVDKRWEAARGFALDDEIRVTIAAQAALLALGLPDDAYDDVGTIIVHPTTMRLTGPRPGPVHGTMTDSPRSLLGQAHYDGPVIIAWDAARASARHPERGHNVVFHEFAHKLDMRDGLVDGTPPLRSEAERRRWIAVCSEELELLRRGPDELLGSYAATNPAEFFAVATELFFGTPVELEAAKPELYDVLRGFYRQDPAQRARSVPR